MSDLNISINDTSSNTYESQVIHSDIPTKKQEFLAELGGTYIFILFSLGNIAQLVLYNSINMTWAGVSTAWGLALYFGILSSVSVSGAHLNPAVTLALAVYRKFDYKKIWYYMLAQVLGAFCASVNVYLVYYTAINKLGHNQLTASIFTTFKNDDVSLGFAFLTEAFGTALLVGGIFLITNPKNNINSKIIPVYISALLTVIVLSFGYQTAFALNPARDLGPRLFTVIAGWTSFSYENYYFWVPLTADFIGGLIGAGIVTLLQH